MSDSDLIFVTDTAKTLIFFTYDPVRNVFGGNGEDLRTEAMRKLQEWLDERLT